MMFHYFWVQINGRAVTGPPCHDWGYLHRAIGHNLDARSLNGAGLSL